MPERPLCSRRPCATPPSRLTREQCDAATELGTEFCRHGRWPEALTVWKQALRHGDAVGALGAVAVLHLNLSDVLLRRGEWEEAAEHLENAGQLSEQFDFPHIAVDVLVNRALLLWHQGEVGEIEGVAREALERAQALGTAWAESEARVLMALSLIDGADLVNARKVLAAAPYHEAASHLAWRDDRELAVLAGARLAAREGDAAAAVRTLAAALEGRGEPYATALLKLELAEICREAEPESARRLAREAAELLSRLGAAPLLDRAEAFLRAAPVP